MNLKQSVNWVGLCCILLVVVSSRRGDVKRGKYITDTLSEQRCRVSSTPVSLGRDRLSPSMKPEPGWLLSCMTLL